MKKNVLQKTLALVLTGAMAMGTLAGCGSSNDTDSSASANTAADTATEAAADTAVEAADADTVAGIDGWTAFENTVELEIPVYNRDNPDWADPDDNYWTNWVQENFGDKYNINVTYVPIARGDVLTDYNLLAADGNLPTILMEYDFPKQAQWVEDGFLQTYDLEEFAKVAPTYYQRMVDLGQIQYTELNGECYFALAERPYSDTNYTWVTFYRQDWLDQIGYSEYPKTWEEQKKMYQALKDAGICDYPLGGAMLNGVGADQNYSFREFPEDELTWATVGDYAIPALGSEANKKFLQRENEKYNLGFINPEYYITDTETDKANFVAGKTLQYSGYISSNMDFVSGVYEQNPEAKLGVLTYSVDEAVDAESDWVPGAFRANNPFGMMVSFAFDATEDELKAAWMYMEWMTQEENLFTMQWGEEGVNYTMGDDGLPVAIANEEVGSEKKQGFNNNKDVWCVTIEAKTAGTIEDVIRANSPQDLPDNFTDAIIENYYNQKDIFAAGYGVTDCMFATTIQSVTDNQETLISDYINYRDQLVMTDPANFDALYEELAQDYLDAGFQDIIDERQTAYESGLSSTLK